MSKQGPREIVISACLNGYIVNIGCQKAVFEKPETVGMEIARYLKNPVGVEMEYLEKAVNKSRPVEAAENVAARPPARDGMYIDPLSQGSVGGGLASQSVQPPVVGSTHPV